MIALAPDALRAVVYHAPPVTRYKDTRAAAEEGTNAVAGLATSTDGALLLAADWNSLRVQRYLANRLGPDAELVGEHIDALVASGLDVVSFLYVRQVRGVRLGTDHPWGALRVTVRRRRFLAPKRVVWFYNIRVGRDAVQVAREVRAMLAKRRVLALFLVEASGYRLPPVATHQHVRDRTSASRANVAAYVKRGHLREVRWVDLDHMWKRTEHPGMHDPRSFLVLDIAWKRDRR